MEIKNKRVKKEKKEKTIKTKNKTDKKASKTQKSSSYIDISKLKKDKENLQNKKYRDYIMNKIEEFNNNGKHTIVYFCDTFYPIIDGVIKVLDNYASLLNDRYNIVVIVPKHKNIVIKKNYLVIGVSSLYFKFVNYDLAFPEVDAFLAQAMKKLRIDVVHSHSPFNMGAYAAKLAKKKKVPFVMTMHSQFKKDFMKYTNSEAMTNYMLKQIVKVFNKSQEVWTMNEQTKGVLESYGYKGKFHLIPNGTDYVVPNNLEELKDRANEKYHLDKNQFVMLFVGRLVEQKNVFYMVDALKKAKDANRNFKMFFVGNGPDEATLKTKVKKLGLENDVIFTGRISDREELACIYARSNLFLFPSLYDMSALVQIEAATFKTPTIFIEGSVTSASVTNDVNGFTAPADLDQFADRIINLIDNPEYVNKIGEKAFEDLYKSWAQIAELCAERYEYLIKQNKNKQAKLLAIKNAKIFK